MGLEFFGVPRLNPFLETVNPHPGKNVETGRDIAFDLHVHIGKSKILFDRGSSPSPFHFPLFKLYIEHLLGGYQQWRFYVGVEVFQLCPSPQLKCQPPFSFGRSVKLHQLMSIALIKLVMTFSLFLLIRLFRELGAQQHVDFALWHSQPSLRH